MNTQAPREFESRPAEGLNYPNVAQMFLARAHKSPDVAALRFKRDEVWRSLSWRAWERRARELAAGMINDLGVGVGDRVAIMATTRVEWAVCDLAITLCGAVSVPIYATSTGAEIAFMIADSCASVAIFEHPEMIARLRAHEAELASPGEAELDADPSLSWQHRSAGCLRHLVVLDRRGGRERAVDLEQVEAAPQASLQTLDALIEVGRHALDRVNDVHPKIEGVIATLELADVFTIVYTSGTTGRPKGVVLSHQNMVYEAWAIKSSFAVDSTDQHLLMLPLAHIFGRHLLWAAVDSGSVTAFAESPAAAVQDMLEIAPTYVGAVPRTYEKIHLRLREEFASRSRAERAMIDWSFAIGRRVSLLRQRGASLPLSLAARGRVADKIVFEDIRARFGGRLRFFISGAAPLRRETAEFFHAAGLLILEGYGLTETTGATNVNRPDRFRFGTVGPSVPGCEVLIAADGEILLRGHNVMVGYHGMPEETAAAIDDDGWFHTGDVGEHSGGFLRITDRRKDIIITAGGKNIAPQKLESQLRARKGMGEVLVSGDRQPRVVALISLDEAEMMEIAQREGLGCRTYADLARHPRIRAIVAGYVEELNRKLAGFEAIKAFEIVAEPWQAQDLTPTHKLRRRAVEARHAQLIEELYRRAAAR